MRGFTHSIKIVILALKQIILKLLYRLKILKRNSLQEEDLNIEDIIKQIDIKNYKNYSIFDYNIQ